MGYNTTILILNDALDDIERDPHFGRKLVAAVSKASVLDGRRNDISGVQYAYVATVIESHHADSTAIVAIGGNTGTDITTLPGWSHPENSLELIERLVEQLPITTETVEINTQIQLLKRAKENQH